VTRFEICEPGRGFYAAGDENGPFDGRPLGLELDALGPQAVLEGDLIGRRLVRLCRALVDEGGESFACLGLVIDADEPEAEVRRSAGLVLGDGALLAVAAARQPGAEEHDAEEVAAVLVEPDGGESRFERTLLSTEYDGQGRHRRATLELEAGNADPPMRGAGLAIEATWLEGPSGGGPFFRWRLEGREGYGRYEIAAPR
jgi:hypothetical protein